MFTTYLTTFLTLFTALAESKPLPIPPPSTTTSTTTTITPRQNTDTTTGLYTWQATGFSFGCGSAACGLRFNVSAPSGYTSSSTSPAPAFDVQCGSQFGVGWTDCTAAAGEGGPYPTSSESKVQALWVTGNGTAGTAAPYQVHVSHTWFDGAAGAQWNATGEGSAAANGVDFEVRGTRLVGEVA